MKKYRLFICIVAIIISIFCTVFSFGLLGTTDYSRFLKCIFGFFLLINPLTVLQLIILLYKK